MANSVMELLDMLYEMIDDAKGGLGGFCKIERDKALDILDEVRGQLSGRDQRGAEADGNPQRVYGKCKGGR